MSAALGITNSSGASLPRFLKGSKIAPYVGAELSDKLAQPLIFQWSALGSTQPPASIYGYDVTILIDICKAIIKAQEKGGLLKRQEHAKQAQGLKKPTATKKK